MNDRERYYSAASRRPWLYISGPMRGGEPWSNIREGIQVATEAWKAGWHPVCPHLNSFWETVVGPLDPRSLDEANGWMEYDVSFLTRCDALLRMVGPSPGADREVDVMELVKKPVIRFVGSNYVHFFPRPSAYLEYIGGVWLPKTRD